jgi:hypothetical protein
MALPTAPLGSLPNLNLPTSRQQYQKPDSVLDKALAAFLVNVATQAGGQMGENVFAKDYGSEPTSLWKKPFVGPQVGEREHLMGKQEAAQTERFNTGEKNASDRLDRQLTASSEDARLGRELQATLEGRRLKHELDKLGMQNVFSQSAEERAFIRGLAMADVGLENTKTLEEYKRTQLPLSATDASQVSLNAARIEQLQLENALLNKRLAMYENPQAGAEAQPPGLNLSEAELDALRDTPTQPGVVDPSGQPVPVAPPTSPELTQLMLMLQQSFGQPGIPQMDPALIQQQSPTLQRNF